MNFRKLLTYFAFGTAAVMPFAGAQNPTILQGNYITNVFGNSNFVLNPNAQTNTANVTFTSTQVTRSTTTPLVATSEFNLSLLQNANADWSTRTFDAGMKGQNCEARFTYRGFATATTTAQIIQNSLVVAQLVLTPSTDPRIASINFPCGDLSFGTTFRIAQTTAAMTGTNEIGGIYVGLATNMANVAQAEFVGSLTWSAVSDVTTVTSTSYTAFPAFSTAPTVLGNLTSPSNAPAFTISSLKPGNYRVILSGQCATIAGTVTDTSAFYRLTDGSIQYGTAFISRNINPTSGTNIGDGHPCGSFDFQYSGATISKTFQIEGAVALSGNNVRIERSSYNGFQISVYRFPSSSELVVKPETQNVFASIKQYNDQNSLSVTSASWTAATSATAWTKEWFGKAKQETTNDVKITIDNLPVGNYYITATGVFYTNSNGSGATTQCAFAIADSPTGGAQITSMGVDSTGDASATAQNILGSTMGGVYKNTAVANRSFYIQGYRVSGTGTCLLFSNSIRPLTITVIPLDQPSNSALYVQGPVLGAQTGAAIPAGYVGQEISTEQNSFTSGLVNGSTVGFLSITLTPGTWLISASQSVVQNGSTGTAVSSVLSDVSATGNTVTGVGASVNDLGNWPPNNITQATITHPSFIYSTSTSKTIYLNSYSVFSAGTPLRRGTLRAVRIN